MDKVAAHCHGTGSPRWPGPPWHNGPSPVLPWHGCQTPTQHEESGGVFAPCVSLGGPHNGMPPVRGGKHEDQVCRGEGSVAWGLPPFQPLQASVHPREDAAGCQSSAAGAQDAHSEGRW